MWTCMLPRELIWERVVPFVCSRGADVIGSGSTCILPRELYLGESGSTCMLPRELIFEGMALPVCYPGSWSGRGCLHQYASQGVDLEGGGSSCLLPWGADLGEGDSTSMLPRELILEGAAPPYAIVWHSSHSANCKAKFENLNSLVGKCNARNVFQSHSNWLVLKSAKPLHKLSEKTLLFYHLTDFISRKETFDKIYC